MFYYNGNWYQDQTAEDITDIIKECFSPDLARILKAALENRDQADTEYLGSLLREHYENETESLRNTIWKLEKEMPPEPVLMPGMDEHTPVCRVKASVPVHVSNYHEKGEEPYEKYSCPICRHGNIRIGLTKPADSQYSSCPCCGVTLDWGMRETENEGTVPLF